jgi:glutathione S-transferase
MKLYYVTGACSLADRIALAEAGIACDFIRVDLHTRTTENGASFDAVNAKGYVPVLVLDSGEMITENIAILSWIAEQAPALRPEGPLGWFRLLEATAYISTEIHGGFKPFFHAGSPDEKARAAAEVGKRLGYLAESMDGDFLLGPNLSVADAYLFVMLTWARRNELQIPPRLEAFYARMSTRETVRTALAQEGLLEALAA